MNETSGPSGPFTCDGCHSTVDAAWIDTTLGAVACHPCFIAMIADFKAMVARFTWRPATPAHQTSARETDVGPPASPPETTRPGPGEPA